MKKKPTPKKTKPTKPPLKKRLADSVQKIGEALGDALSER